MLLGDEERPFPNRLGTTMKYLFGSSAIPAPIIGSLSVCLLLKNVGKTIALSLRAFNSP